MMTIEQRLARFCEDCPDPTPEIAKAVQASEYFAEQFRRLPDIAALLPLIGEEYDFCAAWTASPHAEDEAAFLQALRLFKHRHQAALIYAAVNRIISQPVFLTRISQLAQTLTQAALDYQYQALTRRYGYPCDEHGTPIQMVVLGMGKFGGGELNFSSDIDLIFAYRNGGETRAEAGQKATEHETFFRKLAQKLIYSLDNITAEGMVYRVDMRLRPFGQTGPLALSFEAMENYYLIHGRDWERYAMMKARPVAGDIAGGEQLLQTLRPFIYRRYLDYRALHAIAEMKQEINRQIRQDGMRSDIKLGQGGIREAEFSVQARQMIYGGQYPRLQTPNYLTALIHLSELGFCPPEEAADLRQAYLILRNIENALQFDREQQTHTLPDTPEAWQRLSIAAGYADEQALKADLKAAKNRIHAQFNTVFAKEQTPTTDSALQHIDWSEPDNPFLRHWLDEHQLDFAGCDNISTQLQQFARRINRQRLPRQTRKRIQRLLPNVLQQCAERPERATGIAGLLDLIVAVIGRSVYIDMLAEQPSLTAHLLDIAADSAWLIQFIAAHPIVFEDIISENSITVGIEALKANLQARLQNIDDEEIWQHALRDFKHIQVFKTAWADVHGTLPLMQVSDQLSHIAQLTLQTALNHVSRHLQQKYGIPRDSAGNPARIAVIGYGKLGGLELGYGSDLDIIYLYDDGNSQGYTDGAKSVDNFVYFTRLVQRINNLLSAASINGCIYETDTRLRPGGNSGLPVCSLQAFERYQYDNAWTWEHQALTRARAVAGDAGLMQQFERIRRQVLTQPRPESLGEEILAMRHKMLANHASKPESFHLKKDPGGLIDIEFTVQYLILKHAAAEPILIRMSDNIRQLAALEATGILSSSAAMTLRDAYRRLRHEAHRRHLNGQDNVVSPQPWQEIRRQVQAIQQAVFQSASPS